MTTRNRCLLLWLSLSLLPAMARADGTQTGIIAGQVVDSTQAGLPGVEVTISGPQIERSALTDEEGRFRFPALELGTYRVAAELLGLRASVPDVQVFLGRTSEVRLVLVEGAPDVAGEREPAAREWIQVVAEAPVIDKYDARVGGSVSFDFLDGLPVQRFYQSVALVLPGISGGPDGNPNVSGALRGSNLFLIDGVDTTDPTTGLFGLNLNYEAIQEVNVATAALPAEYGRASGAVVNVVTRSGGNAYEGTLRWLATNNDWNSDYADPVAELGYLAAPVAAANAGPDEINQAVALNFGGPVREDRLWFFAAYEDAESAFLAPTAGGSLWDQGAALESAALKLTARAGRRSTVVAQHTVDSARFTAFTPFNRGATENRAAPRPSALRGSDFGQIPGDLFTLQDQSQEGSFSKLQWNTALSQSLSFEVTVARQERELESGPRFRRGVTADAPHFSITDFQPRSEDPFDIDVLGLVLYNGIPDEGFERRPRRQGNVALNWFVETGRADHEVKAGIDYQTTDSERFFNFAGLDGTDPATGRPVQGQLFFDLDPACPGQGCVSFDPGSGAFHPYWLFNFWARAPRTTSEEAAAVYLSDTIAAGHWVVSLGARLESVRGEDDGGAVLIDDRTVAPRAAATYDPLGDGKSLFSLAYGRYAEPFLQQYLDAFIAAEAFSGYTFSVWIPDFGPCGDPGSFDSPCWFPASEAGFFNVQTAPANRSLRSSSVDELVVGFERQLTATTGLSLHYVGREWNDLWDNAVLGRVEDGAVTFDRSEIRNLEEARRRYRALQLLFQKRSSGNWQLLGSYTRSKAEGNLFQSDGLANFVDYGNLTDVNRVNRFGLAPYDREHQFKVFASVRVPFGRWGLSLGTAVRYESGTPYQLEVGDPRGLGVRFLAPRGSERLPEVLQLDLALGTEIRLGEGIDLEARAEVFNLTDEQEVLGVETRVDFGIAGLPRTTADLQAPRNYRFSLGLRF